MLKVNLTVGLTELLGENFGTLFIPTPDAELVPVVGTAGYLHLSPTVRLVVAKTAVTDPIFFLYKKVRRPRSVYLYSFKPEGYIGRHRFRYRNWVKLNEILQIYRDKYNFRNIWSHGIVRQKLGKKLREWKDKGVDFSYLRLVPDGNNLALVTTYGEYRYLLTLSPSPYMKSGL